MSFLTMTPEEDAANTIQLWDISKLSNRLLRVALYRYAANRADCWVYFKVFRQLGEGDCKLTKHHQIHLNFGEIKKLFTECPKIFPELVGFKELAKCSVQEYKNLYKGTVQQDKEYHHITWDISETGRRKITLTCLKYDAENPNSVYVQLKLFKRNDSTEEFLRYNQVNITFREFEELLKQIPELYNSLYNFYNPIM